MSDSIIVWNTERPCEYVTDFEFILRNSGTIIYSILCYENDFHLQVGLNKIIEDDNKLSSHFIKNYT